ncbi:hypothetical protein D1867_11165 [Acidianus infernus]|uniref:Uncharacterized protein n=1 Tax=Acidianus infernus TaxID=12915 RepID=A0A6A9QKM8_ACIIN|nr:hypothetical protein [Acidianus infernus]MUM65786.1 hypothetical protein [Acidianus infernus]
MKFLIREGSSFSYYYLVRDSSTSKVFKASVTLGEFDDLILKKINAEYKRTKKTISTDNERIFKILVVYGGVRQTMRKVLASRINKLSDVLINMDEFSLHYWYSEFLTRFSRRNNVVDTYRVGRAFRDLYE